MNMDSKKNSDNEIILDVKKLTNEQKRIVCNINAHLLTLLTTQNEGDYFQNSLEVFKCLTFGFKLANFCKENLTSSAIPYDKQVLEYSMDFLSDSLESVKTMDH